MGVTAAVYESFVVSTANEIRIMSAIPLEMKSGYMHGLHTRAKTVVDIDFDSANITVKIVALLDTEFCLVLPNGDKVFIKLSKGESYCECIMR